MLKINSVQREDRGTYYCIADNGDRRQISLEVEFAPTINVSRPQIGQALGYDTDLKCSIEAYPLPSIVWLKDEVQLSNSQHYSISHFARPDELIDTTIRLKTIEKSHYGYYVCKAVNKLGQAEDNVFLFETIFPVCPQACNQANNRGADTVVIYLTYYFLILTFAAIITL